MQQLLAKIAVPAKRLLARGDGWSVEDIVCTAGPHDRPFEEQHCGFSVAVVAVGSFQYRSAAGRELLTPGSLLLGTSGQNFECSHAHATGDRCIAFRFTPDAFGRLGIAPRFRRFRVPPLRDTAALVARACAGLGGVDVPWEELGVRLAARAVQLADDVGTSAPPPGAEGRVTRTIRTIERHHDDRLTLGKLAGIAGLSPYHFLRVFERVTGLTPHQYLRRARLRQAAVRLAAEPAKVVDVALDSGFGDVSNFNRAFREEFGVSPRAYRRQARG